MSSRLALLFFLTGSLLAATFAALPNPPAEAVCYTSSAVALSSSGYQSGSPPENTMDGSLVTGWADEGKGSWIKYNIGTQKSVCYVDIAWYKGTERQYTFAVSTSTDGINYTDAYTGKSSGSTLSLQRYDFPDRLAKYIMIKVNGNTENDWAAINEVKIHYYSPSIDTTVPAVSITSPSSGSSVAGPSSGVTVNITGTSSDSGSGVRFVEVRTQNTSYQPAIPKDAGDWSTWKHTRVLPPGTHTLIARATDNAGNERWYTTKVVVTSTETDKFGITKLHDTKSGGREWLAKWNSNPRTLGWGWDPYDPEFDIHGQINYVKVNGDGTARVSGDAPRFYIHDKTNSKNWQNVEITYYVKRISESKSATYQAFTAGARNGWAESKDNCDGFGYYGMMKFNGQAVFQKELINHVAYSTLAPYPWPTPWSGDGPFPKDQWIGVKFIVQNINGGKGVKLQMYYDTTDGKNGGNWQKAAEYVDNGSWFASGVPWGSNAYTWIDCGSWRAQNWVITNGYPTVMLRSDYISAADYKKFSVREINPLP
ncbi:discoidin domain-containing protein [Nitrososphaera sp.]|uniref:discoidin domain-containing protein n=1 Tax=Nitrososphaera sp. TaxID=1971748 RepID=UPI0025CD66B5|nr:discoidin domain-containing protein [Nitrososphaera sp.]